MAGREYFMGIDNGTQSTKTLIIDGETGRVVGKSSKSYGLIEGLPPGHKEQDPRVWIEALHYTIKQGSRDRPQPHRRDWGFRPAARACSPRR